MTAISQISQLTEVTSLGTDDIFAVEITGSPDYKSRKVKYGTLLGAIQSNISALSGGISNVGNTAGTSGVVTGQLIFAGGNNITVSQSLNAGSATISIVGPTQSNQSLGIFVAGNSTQGSSGTIDARSFTFNAIGAASIGITNGSVEISVPVQTNQTLGAFAVGNTTQSTSRTIDARSLSFSGAGNVSVGVSNGSVVISGSAVAQTNQSMGVYVLGQTTGQSSSSTIDARSLSISAVNGASAGMSAGVLVISAATGAGGGGSFSAGVSNIGNTLGSTGTVSNQIVFAGGNNIVLSQSTGAGGATVTISASGQTNQSVGFYAVGNTTQNSSTTLDARTISLNGLGAATVGYSNGSVQISVPVQTNQAMSLFALGNTTQNSSTSRDARSLSFNGLGGITVGYSNGSIQVSGPVAQTNQSVGLYALGNTTQNSSTTLDARTISFNGLGGISVGYSNGSVQISGPSGGGGGTVSRTVWPAAQFNSISAYADGSMSFQYMPIPTNLTATRLDVMASISAQSSVIGLSTAMLEQVSIWGGIYTKNGNTLSSLSTGSTLNNNIDLGGISPNINGQRLISCPINVSATPGDYIVMVNISAVWATYSATAGAATINSTNSSTVAGSISMTMYGGTDIGSAAGIRDFGSAAPSATVGLYTGMGIYSVTSNAVPAVVSLSGITQTGTAVQRANIGIQLRG